MRLFFLLFFALILSFSSCSKDAKEIIDGGDFKFWYVRYQDDNDTCVYYFGNNWVCKFFWQISEGHLKMYEIFDDIFIEKWNIKDDSIIEINGYKRLILELNDSIMIMDASYDRDWSRIDTFRAAPRSMIPDEFYHRY